MSKWGVRSMIWYVFILVIAFFISLYYYLSLMKDPTIQQIFS